MDSRSNTFQNPGFKAWVTSLEPGARVSCSVTYPDGKIVSCGDPKRGIAAFSAKIRETRQSSMDWVVTASDSVRLNRLLGEFFKKDSLSKLKLLKS